MSLENRFFPGGGGRPQAFGGIVPAAYGSGEPNRIAKVSNEIVGPPERVTDQAEMDTNEKRLAALQAEIDKLGANSTDSRYKGFLESRDALNKEIYTPKADLSQFEGLLGKLEASKMKQAGSAALDTRRNTYAQGLAQMMSNF